MKPKKIGRSWYPVHEDGNKAIFYPFKTEEEFREWIAHNQKTEEINKALRYLWSDTLDQKNALWVLKNSIYHGYATANPQDLDDDALPGWEAVVGTVRDNLEKMAERIEDIEAMVQEIEKEEVTV